ncbi:MAG: MATE family efflux transporter [Steroidobacteraceae bacterium]|nr:MATE family efflux transporter [Steroidobacteraceae bacterium]
MSEPHTEPMARDRIAADIRAIARLGGPLLVNNLVIAGMALTNTVMAGRLGRDPLAGVAVGSSYYQMFWLLGLGVLMALSPLVAHAYGAGRDAEVGHRFRQGLWLSQLLALPLLAGLLCVGPVLAWFGTDPAATRHATGYVGAMCFGLPAMLAFLAHRYTTEGIGWTRPIMWTALVGLIVNVGGNFIFTFGNLGAPRLGATGCGVATACAHWAMLITIHVYQRWHRVYRRFGLFGRFEWPEGAALRSILALGLPICGSVISEGALFAVAGLLMGTLGAATVAAHQVALSYGSLMFMIPLSLHSATTIHVGHRVGAGSARAGRRAGWVGIGMCATIMAGSSLVILGANEWIAAAYTPDVTVRSMAAALLVYVAIFQVPDGLQVGAAGALRGFKDAHVPMLMNFAAYWLLGFPVAWWLGIHEGWGPQGIWLGLILGLVACAALLNARYARVSARAVAAPL